MADLTPVAMIETLFHMAQKPENYVPRDYETIGGMWTVDTWKHPVHDYRAQLGDDGSTQMILTDTLIVSTTCGREPFYTRGNELLLRELFDRVF